MDIAQELMSGAMGSVSRLATHGDLPPVVALAWGIPVVVVLALALLRRALARSA